MSDLISKAEVLSLVERMMETYWDKKLILSVVRSNIEKLPSAESETCEGCKHLGKWENEITYGYPSPCTICKRRANDNYER